ncbi:hypothetical protein K9N68_08290 [Kovacikia minuta CCNUW1]|nr:hypothetical protein [Kovacikia minuta]UBF27884.1 hypothetical protein K9N68_08290 [Kovacikia minuta CCNUW1]
MQLFIINDGAKGSLVRWLVDLGGSSEPFGLAVLSAEEEQYCRHVYY